MFKAIALTSLLAIVSCSAGITSPEGDASASASNGSAPKRPVIKGSVQKRDANINHIDFGPNVKKPSSNTFSDISASMPAAAVHEDLRRKNELPSAQTAILHPASGGAVGGTAGGAGAVGSGSGAKYAAQASASQGGSSSGLRGNGLASPDTKGTTNQFFK
jgi:hypothetical protein